MYTYIYIYVSSKMLISIPFLIKRSRGYPWYAGSWRTQIQRVDSLKLRNLQVELMIFSKSPTWTWQSSQWFQGFLPQWKKSELFFLYDQEKFNPLFPSLKALNSPKWFLLELPTSQITLRVEISRSLSRPVQCSVMAFSVVLLRSAVPVWCGRWPGWPNIHCWELICWRFDTPWDVS